MSSPEHFLHSTDAGWVLSPSSPEFLAWALAGSAVSAAMDITPRRGFDASYDSYSPSSYHSTPPSYLSTPHSPYLSTGTSPSSHLSTPPKPRSTIRVAR